MKRLTGNGAGSGRGGVPKAPENTFLSFDLSVRRLPSAPPVVFASASVSLADSMSDCTALHCTAPHCSLLRSSSPKWPHKQALTAAEAAEAVGGGGRRRDGDAIHTFLPLRTATHSLFTTQRRKEVREEGRRDGGMEGSRRRRRWRPKKFSHFLSLPLSFSSTLPLLLSLTRSPLSSRRFCPPLMPAARSERSSSETRARACRQAGERR